MIFSLIFAINQEMMLIVIFGTYIFILIYYLYKKIKIPNSIYIMVLISILGFLNISICPGNHIRYSTEIFAWFPDYGTLNLLNKLDIGITTMFYKLLLKIDLVVLLFFGAIGTYTYLIMNKKKTLVSFIPFFFLSFIYTLNILNVHSTISLFESNFPVYGIFASNLNFIIVFTPLYLLVILSILYNLIQIYKHKVMFYKLLCLLLLAIASQLILGFSPTVWASEDRWWIIYHILISITTFILMSDLLKTKFLENKMNPST